MVNLSRKKYVRLLVVALIHLFDQYDRRKSRQYELWTHQSTEL